jgi:hypothetical protein
MRGGAMPGIHRDLAWDEAARDQRRCQLAQLFVVHGHRRNDAPLLVLRNDLGIGRHLFVGIRHRLLDLNAHHVDKFRRIGRGQAKSLRQHKVDGQGENDVILRAQQCGGLIEGRYRPHFPRAIAFAKAHHVPAVRGGDYVDAFRCRLDIKAPSK